MEKLSAEHIGLIFSQIETRADLTNFRLVQRSFAEIGSRYLHLEIYVYPSLGSVKRLLKISQDPNIAPLVKTLIFGDGLQIPRPKLNRIYRRCGDSDLKYGGPSILSKICVVSYLTKCYKFQKSALFTQSIINSLENLTKVQHIVFGNPYFPPRTHITQFWENEMMVEAGYDQNLASLRTFRAIANGVYYSKTKLRSFKYTYLEQIHLLDGFRKKSKLNYPQIPQSPANLPLIYTHYPQFENVEASALVGEDAWLKLYEDFLVINLEGTPALNTRFKADSSPKNFMAYFGVRGMTHQYGQSTLSWLKPRTQNLLVEVMNHLVNDWETPEAKNAFACFLKLGPSCNQQHETAVSKIISKYLRIEGFSGTI